MIERDIENLLRRADRDDYDPYLLPGDALACYDSTVTNITEIARVIGTLVAFQLIPLGEEGYKLAGVFCATYIGGSMNYVAASQALDLQSADLLTAGIAAVGGMIVPAAIYAALNWDGGVALNGWAIPAATDIAFQDEFDSVLPTASVLPPAACCGAGAGLSPFPHGHLGCEPHRRGGPWVARGLLSPAGRSYLPTSSAYLAKSSRCFAA